ncbi:MAG: hypothetical protein KGJ59_05535 [Bacteroidota bacterium]|nr:hypothetical protein [Bacteroidota bacterium]
MNLLFKSFAAIFPAALLLACSNATDQGGYTDWASPVVAQTVTAKTLSSVSFLAHAAWGNSCGRFSRAVVAKNGSVYSIKILGKQPKDAVCLAVVIAFEAPVTIGIFSPGTYTFKFWQSDSTTLDTPLTVP